VNGPLTTRAEEGLVEACVLFYESILKDIDDVACRPLYSIRSGERIIDVGLEVSGTPVGDFDEDEFTETLVTVLNENSDVLVLFLQGSGNLESRAYFANLKSVTAFDPEDKPPSDPPAAAPGKGGSRSKRSKSSKSSKKAKGGKKYSKKKSGKGGKRKGPVWSHVDAYDGDADSFFDHLKEERNDYHKRNRGGYRQRNI